MTITDDPSTDTAVLGTRLLRKEDPVLLTGEAVFTNDMKVPGALHMAVLRSPYAHAKIVSIDTSAAAAMPGVRAVYTGADLADLWAAPMPCAWPVTDDMLNPPHHPLATDTRQLRRRRCGRRARRQRRDRPRRHRGDRRHLRPAGGGHRPRRRTERPRARPPRDLGTNSSYTWNLLVEETDGAVQQAFDDAAYTVNERYVQQRLIPMAMEPGPSSRCPNRSAATSRCTPPPRSPTCSR